MGIMTARNIQIWTIDGKTKIDSQFIDKWVVRLVENALSKEAAKLEKANQISLKDIRQGDTSITWPRSKTVFNNDECTKPIHAINQVFDTIYVSTPHTHKTKNQILYVIDKSIRIDVTRGPRGNCLPNTFHLKKGQGVCIPAGREHNVIAPLPGTRMLNIYTCASYPMGFKLFKLPCFTIKGLFDAIYSNPSILTLPLGNFLMKQLPGWPNAHPRINIIPSRESDLKMLSLLEAHETERVTHEMLEKLTGHKRRTNQEELRMGFNSSLKPLFNYIICLDAITLLVQDGWCVHTVAAHFGFKTSGNFMKMFKATTGVNPSLYAQFDFEHCLVYNPRIGVVPEYDFPGGLFD